MYFFLSFPLSRHFSLSSPLLILKSCMLGLALKMKTHCLSGEKQLEIVGMHKACAKEVEISAKLGHPKTTIYIIIKRLMVMG